MISKNKIKVMALMGLITIGIGYKTIDNSLDRNLVSIIREKGYAPEWAALLPGKADKILSIYLDKMKNYYETGHPQMSNEGFDRAWDFAKEHNPQRLEEVCTKTVDFLLEKGEVGDAIDYAKFFTRQFNTIFNDDRLIKKTAKYKCDLKVENDRLKKRVEWYHLEHNEYFSENN